MGLSGVPFTFQRVAETVIRDILYDIVLVYLDDFIVKSTTFEQHFRDLRQVLEKLFEARFKLKLRKCSFAQATLTYLGHVISGEGITPDPDKVRAIVEFPKPTTRKELQRFLGLCNRINKFIPNHAVTAAPLSDLIKKKAKVEKNWAAIHDKAFAEVKENAKNAILLTLPDHSKEFKVYTDASAIGVGDF